MARLPRLTTRLTTRRPGAAPPVASLLDVDFYKFTMGQFVFRRHPAVGVRYRLICRDRDANLAALLPAEEFRDALEGVRGLSFRPAELDYLRDLGGGALFGEDFLSFLSRLRLPPFELAVDGGGFRLEVEAGWAEGILWETLFLSTLSELLVRAALAAGGAGAEREALAAGRENLARKIEVLRGEPGVRFASFGTRRRFSREWQQEVEERLAEALPGQFVGTSAVASAFRHGLAPVGTVAHEVFMVGAALGADSDEAVAGSFLETADAWRDDYGAPYSVFLTDTWGSESYFREVDSARAARFRGVRHDSGDPAAFGERALRWYRERGVDAAAKTLVFSDGLRVEDLVSLHRRFRGRIGVSFGWGTNLTHDCGLPTYSLVVKPVSANGRPLVKLSDDANKTVGDPEEVARYRRIFDCPAVFGPPPRY